MYSTHKRTEIGPRRTVVLLVCVGALAACSARQTALGASDQDSESEPSETVGETESVATLPDVVDSPEPIDELALLWEFDVRTGQAWGCATNSDGNVNLVGSDSLDAWMAQIDASTPTLIWDRDYESSGYAVLVGTATTADGRIYATGAWDGDILLAEYSQEGDEIDRWDLGLGNGVAVQIVDSTTLVVTGEASSVGWLGAYSTSDKSELWLTNFDTEGNDAGRAVFAGSANEFTLASVRSPVPPVYEGWMTRVDGSGTTVWDRRLELEADHVVAAGIAADSEGAVFVAGERRIGSERNAFVQKYDPMGGLVWTDVRTESSRYTTLLAMPSGSIMVGGQGTAVDGSEEPGRFLVAEFTAAGVPAAEFLGDSPAPDAGDSLVECLTLADDGSVVATGWYDSYGVGETVWAAAFSL